MGGRVDSVGESRDDDDPRPGEARGDEPGRLEAGARGAPGADEGDDRSVPEGLAPDEQDRRRIGRLAEEGRVLRVADRDDAGSGLLEAAAGLGEARRRRGVEEGGHVRNFGAGERRRLPGGTVERVFDRSRGAEEPREDAGPGAAHAQTPREDDVGVHPLGPHLA